VADVGAADPLNERLQRARKQGVSSTSLLALGVVGLVVVIAVVVLLLILSDDQAADNTNAQANASGRNDAAAAQPHTYGQSAASNATIDNTAEDIAAGGNGSADNTQENNASKAASTGMPGASLLTPTLWKGSLVDPRHANTVLVPNDPNWSYVGPDWAGDVMATDVLTDQLLLLGGMQFQTVSFADQNSPTPLRLLTNEEGFRPGKLISPDGRYVLGESQTSTSTERKLAVASTEIGAIIARMEGVNSAPRFTEFLTTDQLLTIDRRPAAPWQVNIFRLPENQPARTFTLPALHEAYDDFTPEFAISPGRKYLAFGSADGVLRMIEIATGEVSAELRFDLPRGRWAVAKSVEFSPDGAELAVWYKSDEYPGGPPNSRIVCWDLATGKLLDQHDFNVSLSRVRNRLHHSQQLVWLPDGSGWIASGKWLVDRTSGKIIWSLQLPDDAQSLALLEPLDGARLLLGYLRNDPSAPKRNLVLQALTLPESEIQAAREMAQSGQQPDVPDLPTDKVVDIL
jgi:hypothetical protein